MTPGGGDHFKVFTPYHRAWSAAAAARAATGAAQARGAERSCAAGRLPALESLTGGSPRRRARRAARPRARKRMRAFLRDGLGRYDDRHDDLAGRRHLAAQRLPPLGLRLAAGAGAARRASGAAAAPSCGSSAGATSTTRCWPRPRPCRAATTAARGDRWSRSERAFEAWQEGRTGYPLVDAAMRQLAEEGFMHNRARMTVASFLCKDLYVDWRAGAWHFWDLLDRRRDRQQRRQLAVGRRDRQRHPAATAC